MSDQIALPSMSRAIPRRLAGLLGVALVALLAAQLQPMARTELASFSATVVFVVAALGVVGILRRRALARTADVVLDFLRHDPAVCVVTDLEGQVCGANRSGRNRLSIAPGATLAQCLRFWMADPGLVLLRLRDRLTTSEQVEEAVFLAGRRGHVLAHRLGPAHILWRITGDGGQDGSAFVHHLPLVTVGRNGVILSLSDAARRLLGWRPRTLGEVMAEPSASDTGSCLLRLPDGPRRAQVVEAASAPGRRDLLLLPEATPPASAEGNFEGLPVPILGLKRDGTITGSNASARALLGPGVHSGMQLSYLFRGLGRTVEDWFADAAENPSQHRSEFLRLTHCDRETYVQVTLKNISGWPKTDMIAVMTDATELKSLEAQFVQSQKMQAIGQLAGGVAHDFNNLLTAISGHCDLLLLRRDRGDPDYADLIQINQNANRAAALVGQLLAFSRKQNLNPELLDLRSTLSDLTHLLNRLVGEKISLRLGHAPEPLHIRADKRQLEQVMMNLVVNARDAMPNGGEISIRTSVSVLEAPWNRARATVPAGTYACITVEDQGSGMTPKTMEKIFEPFFTTKRTGEGTGLGLSTAYGIVKQSGGFIFVDSVLGAGSTFTLLFRRDDGIAVLPAAAPPQAHDDTPSRGGVILLVEDEAPVRAFASRALRLGGYTVIEADSGERALEALRDTSLQVDLVVTDVIMPGLDGPGWVRQALEDRPGLSVVFVSGYPEDVFDRDDARIPKSVFLPKPFSLAALTSTVKSQLRRSA